MKWKLCSLIGFFCTISLVAEGQHVPDARKTDWSGAGYKGLIPVYPIVKHITDFGGAGNGTTANDAAMQAAISSLNGQRGIILFPAGNFLFNNTVQLASNIILKGAGAGNTTLLFNLGGSRNAIIAQGNTTNEVAGLASPALKDASVLTVDNSSIFRPGDYIKIYQDDSELINDSWAAGSVAQILMIDSIRNNDIYFPTALRRNYLLADAPKIARLNMIKGVGIECLKIKRLDSTAAQTANIFFSAAADCWVQGVESDSCNFAHLQMRNSSSLQVTNNYFHGSFGYGGGGQGYGISCEFSSGDCLIENNVFDHLRHSMLLQSGANGNVFSYNYSINPYKTDTIPYDLSGDIVLHGNYPYLNLFEGNIVQNIIVDASHGINGPFNTFLRNRASSYGIIITPGAGDSSNLVGNEITGSGFGKGNCILFGNGHLQYVNNKNDTIMLPGTDSLSLVSYLYTAPPAFWAGENSWPSVGTPQPFNTGSIPAKDRYSSSRSIATCSTGIAATYHFTGNGNWSNPANWTNVIPPALTGAGSEIIIDPPGNGACIIDVPVTIATAVKLTVKSGRQLIIRGNLIVTQ